MDNVDVEPLNLAGHPGDLQEELLHYDHQQSLPIFIIYYPSMAILAIVHLYYDGVILEFVLGHIGWSDFAKKNLTLSMLC